ncbi:hypothetical protein ElyMa_006847200 [Elysia marginata]|uniref:Uncharacterized protein n=1 Tax=Elysia marginata TaxID=1093978 RepID=A0AAV4JAL9_9GAST|nr:hypothetical protein ElyMa_006847200 [Elysia marginata]
MCLKQRSFTRDSCFSSYHATQGQTAEQSSRDKISPSNDDIAENDTTDNNDDNNLQQEPNFGKHGIQLRHRSPGQPTNPFPKTSKSRTANNAKYIHFKTFSPSPIVPNHKKTGSIMGGDSRTEVFPFHNMNTSSHQTLPASVDRIDLAELPSTLHRQETENGNFQSMPRSSITTLPINLDLAPPLPLAPPPYFWWLCNKAGGVNIPRGHPGEFPALNSNSKT